MSCGTRICRVFQHTAARRRLSGDANHAALYLGVSTHSRPKAAESLGIPFNLYEDVSTHSRPKAADATAHTCAGGYLFQHTAARRRLNCCMGESDEYCGVSTHSRPKAAETGFANNAAARAVSTHSRPKAAEPAPPQKPCCKRWFQHTAARRRLILRSDGTGWHGRFQHTAARRRLRGRAETRFFARMRFNTQPPEGG